jgi:hypothetical protein
METHKVFNFNKPESSTFWSEIAPCEHLLQFYEDGTIFLDTLVGFVGGGLFAGDGIIVIATEAHLDALRMRLIASGHDIDTALRNDQYVPLDAEETLAMFMVNGWPDEERFEAAVTKLLLRARGPEQARKVRAFGEMVAILWAKGHKAATVRLEQLWHALCQKESFSLLCAYPMHGMTKQASESVSDICALHSKLVA